MLTFIVETLEVVEKNLIILDKEFGVPFVAELN